MKNNQMNQINEVMESMKSFRASKYQRSEVLPELLNLQREMIQLTFGSNEENENLKVYDVLNELIKRNALCRNTAGEELERFDREAFQFANDIKALISGNKGEKKAFYELLRINGPKTIIQNVELEENGIHTELDAVVITHKAITIIEVKNTRKDAHIDENGNLFRVGEYLAKDCNIAEKMEMRERFLNNLLLKNGIRDLPMQSVLVFTNDYIEVRNKYSGIKTCFVNNLADTVEELSSRTMIDWEERKQIEKAIKENSQTNFYRMRFDVEQLKRDFATIIVKLGNDTVEENNTNTKQGWLKMMKNRISAGMARVFKIA